MSEATSHRYVTLDVFTAERFAGNPLAVVWDADDLDDDAMLAIAREFGYSETVFLQRTDVAGCDVRTRIFTPGGELPFAGHPTIGTAVALARDRGATNLVFDQPAGPVAVTMSERSASFTIERDVEVGPPDEVSLDDAASGLGLDPGDLVAGGRAASVGPEFLIVEVASLAVLARCSPASTTLPGEVYVVCRTGDRTWQARMFASSLGIAEDPATGSAATAFAALLALDQPDGEAAWTIDQGVEMGRPSRIGVAANVVAGRPRWIRVSGDAVVVFDGTLGLG